MPDRLEEQDDSEFNPLDKGFRKIGKGVKRLGPPKSNASCNEAHK